MTHEQITTIIENALADALACEDSWEGVDDAKAAIRRDIDDYTHLTIRPAALNCDGLYEPGFDLVLCTGGETYSAAACDLLDPPVQVRRGERTLSLSEFS
jgi:hypothetical protein